MIKIIEGVVLKNSDYQEKSKIIQLFTSEHGLIGVYLKGASDFKNKNYLIAQPITHALFNLNYQPNGLSSSFTGELIDAFSSLKVNFNKNIYVFHLFELLLKNLEQHTPVKYLYDLLLIILNEINQTEEKARIETLTLFYETKLLFFLGVHPQIDCCVECGNVEGIVNFDIHKGGFVCHNCQDFRSRQFSIEAMMSFRNLAYLEVSQLNELNLTEVNLKELRILLNDYFYTHLGIKTNSLKFF